MKKPKNAMRVIFKGTHVETCPISPAQAIHDAERLWPRKEWEDHRQLGDVSYKSGHDVSYEFTRAGNLHAYVWSKKAIEALVRSVREL